MSVASKPMRARFKAGASSFAVDGDKHSVSRGSYSAAHEVAYTIGSGNHAVGFLIRKGPFLFQSPLSFYTQREVWDVAPGYENNLRPDFNRPILAECVYCHAGKPQPVADSVNRYADPPIAAGSEAITCERCHGAAADHLRMPSSANIVNPAKLAPLERSSVCEQCHLGGETRIRNPGRDWHDYKPGEKIEQTFTTYVSAKFRVASHVEQLSLSSCAQKSEGRMWCGTCHNPHQERTNLTVFYRERCQGCHPSQHARESTNCVDCHMKRRKAPDSGHSSFTDHWIRRKPEQVKEDAAVTLRPWREPGPEIVARNFGLAYIAVGEREMSIEKLQKGFEILLPLVQRFPDDAEVLASLASVMYLKNRPKEAALLFEQAVAKRPAFAPYYQKLGVAWNTAGDKARAEKILERAIQLDPSLEGAYHALAELKPPGAQRREVLERYLKFMPESIVTREIIQRLGVPQKGLIR